MHSFCFRRGPSKCHARRRDDGEGDKQLQTKLPASYPKSSDADSEVELIIISSVSNTFELKEVNTKLNIDMCVVFDLIFFIYEKLASLRDPSRCARVTRTTRVWRV